MLRYWFWVKQKENSRREMSSLYVCHSVKYMWERGHVWALLTLICPRKPCSQGDSVLLKKLCCFVHLWHSVHCPWWNVASILKSVVVLQLSCLWCTHVLLCSSLSLYGEMMRLWDIYQGSGSLQVSVSLWAGAHVTPFRFLTSQDISHFLISPSYHAVEQFSVQFLPHQEMDDKWWIKYSQKLSTLKVAVEFFEM